MNKYVLSIALLVASTGAFAQNRLVKKAQGLINNNQIEEAQTLLTEALNSGETKDMALAGAYYYTKVSGPLPRRSRSMERMETYRIPAPDSSGEQLH